MSRIVKVAEGNIVGMIERETVKFTQNRIISKHTANVACYIFDNNEFIKPLNDWNQMAIIGDILTVDQNKFNGIDNKTEVFLLTTDKEHKNTDFGACHLPTHNTNKPLWYCVDDTCGIIIVADSFKNLMSCEHDDDCEFNL